MTIRQGQYWNATKCAGKAEETTTLIQSFLITRHAGMSNGGLYVCRKIEGSSALSTHATGRTGDTMTGTGAPTVAMGFVMEQFRLFSRELGIQGLIYNRRKWFCNQGPLWTPYTGTNPHRNHGHWERIPSSPLTGVQIRRLLTGPAPTGNKAGPVLKRGSSGESVLYVQSRLRAHGFTSVAADGKFGPSTDSAVRRFQRLCGIVDDGSVGPVTRGRLQ